MAAKPKYTTVQQHQPIYAPKNWNEEEKRFVRTLQGIFDDIYKRYGRLGLNDLSKVFRGTVSGLEEGLDSTKTSVNTLVEALELLNTTKLAKSELLNAVYPVGSIYISVSETSPNTLFGGTWERLKDRFLLAAGDSHVAGATGGEAAHTLTVEEMPKHGHAVHVWDNAGTTGNAYYYSGTTKKTHTGARLYNGTASSWVASGSTASAAQEGRGDVSGGTELVGGSAAHNNLPPYLAVYMWKRTA